MKKNLLYFSLLTLSILFSCKDKTVRPTSIPKSAMSYLYQFTEGTIPKTSEFWIIMANDVVTDDMVGSKINSKYLNFIPPISGEAIWKDQRTISFKPHDNWVSGKDYNAQLNIDKLLKLEDVEIPDVTFKFSIKDLFYNVDFEGLRVSEDEKGLFNLKGRLTSSDFIQIEQLENMITASFLHKSLEIDWTHLTNTHHEFTIQNIQKQVNSEELKVKWDGAIAGIDLIDEKIFEVPGLKDFKILNASIDKQDTRKVNFYFSDNLKPDQDLTGIIRVKNENLKIKSEIDANMLILFLTKKMEGDKEFVIQPSIESISGYKLQNVQYFNLNFPVTKPQIKLVGNQSIIPSNDGIHFPFMAVGLNKVFLEIFEVYDNNLLQFLQSHDLERAGHYLSSVGNIVFQKTIDLDVLKENNNYATWEKYSIDLSEFIQKNPKSIYQIRLGFVKDFAVLSSCSFDIKVPSKYANQYYNKSIHPDAKPIQSITESSYNGFDGYYEDFEWADEKNPCKKGYYSSEKTQIGNIVASQIGVLVKGNENLEYFVAVNDILTTEVQSDAIVKFYSFQQQEIGRLTTDADGFGNIKLTEKPFVAIAEIGGKQGFVKIEEGNALSMSKFQVEGSKNKKGINGFFYGERGVWRPGDSIYLNFMLHDPEKSIPKDYPMKITVYNPSNQVNKKFTVYENIDGLYPLHIQTKEDDLTGNWRVKVEVGGTSFSHRLKVETVKPNRLKIGFDITEQVDEEDQLTGELNVKWLHGAIAKNLETKVEMQLYSKNNPFPDLKSYSFSDPARAYKKQDPVVVFDDKVDEKGEGSFQTTIHRNNLPGKLKANFKVRAFEQGGDYSVYSISKVISPFSSYVGVKPKDNEDWWLSVEKPVVFEIKTVNSEGNTIKNHKTSVGLYELNWSWWWDRGHQNIAKYQRADHKNAIKVKHVQSNLKGNAECSFDVKASGRYLVRVCDEVSGHCTGKIVYIGNPYYYSSRNEKGEKPNPHIMGLKLDKEKYEVGDVAKISFPQNIKKGKVLVSLENGTKVIRTFWKELNGENDEFSFYTSEEMSPNAYVNISYIQPHKGLDNDLPIRMYGVIPIYVENKNSHIEPIIKMADELKPETSFDVKILEKEGKPMAYTLAIVDEGLLDLTNFKTPNPWGYFNTKQALGVRTWDLYDDILGKEATSFGKLISIGGDEDTGSSEGKKKANRFVPVVKHLGPFFLEAGKTAIHTIKLPNYIGSVKAMVVAKEGNAYGSTDKTIPVKKPLMVLATLPRFLSPGEKLSLPVSVFSMDKKVKNVNIDVAENTGFVNFETSNNSLNFTEIGDKMSFFNFEVGKKEGIAKFSVNVNNAFDKAHHEIELDVRNPNMMTYDFEEKLVNPNENVSFDYDLMGIEGTNTVNLEISSMPPLNLERRLKYLISYPHGCLEQTTSKAFPMLYLDKMVDLSKEQKIALPEYVNAAITKLKRFMSNDGQFSYWPSGSYYSAWADIYAGNFLVEAKREGYFVPTELLNSWLKNQTSKASNWDDKQFSSGYYKQQSDFLQAYRLYVLALAAQPDLSSMNRLRTFGKISNRAKVFLANAYSLIGKRDVALSLLSGINDLVDNANSWRYNFGDNLRDKAVLLSAFANVGETDKAMNLTKVICAEIGSKRWVSTQSLAFSLNSVAKFLGANNQEPISYNVEIGDDKFSVNTENSFSQTAVLKENFGKTIRVKNNGNKKLFVRLVTGGKPEIGNETEKVEKNLRMVVKYFDADNNELDITNLKKGQDILAQIELYHNASHLARYEYLALNYIIPSGWEIMNERMDGLNVAKDKSAYDYVDYRDDRVSYYFSLERAYKKIFYIRMQATYQGEFYHPGVDCTEMYDNTIHAKSIGKWVKVE